MSLDYRSLMDQAADLARPEHPHPNPRVGTVIVAPGGAIVGRGAHVAAGMPHAEIHALREAGEAAAGASVFVTLEPCSHQGATPPCTDALIAAGVARVVIGIEDPDRRVSGAGITSLRRAGIEVEMDPQPDLFEAVDPGYFHHRRTGRPRVTLKLAMTLDGQTAAADGTSQWITSEEARRDAHELRSRSDAVMVGAGTIIADDPRLTVRFDGLDDLGNRQPRPIVVAGRRPLPVAAKVFDRNPIVYAPLPLDLPGEVVVVGDGPRVDLGGVVADLGGRNVVDLLVEGGAALAAGLEGANLVDRYVLYLSGAIAGGVGRPAFDSVFETIGDQHRLEMLDVRRIGPDLRIEARRQR
ncbi:MAG: bifunctional diaminohydroxyphosphoribosylaminopyrimidine deaminase/5-amino-6-(5-phosphoribosylamino)uracil reductase RibD [Acidimicrobiia bacterium]